jgi:UDP-GlcNAc:undecaprenyl-phosphate GlcNAc-1-phosphate transferase
MLALYFFLVLNGFLVAVVFINILRKFSLVHKFLITKGIPLIGGVGMALSFILVSLLSFFLYKSLSREVIGIIASSAIMLIFGVIDDWRELSIWAKFLVQIIATSLLVFFGIRTQIIYIGNLANIIITFIWVLGITNAFNHLDVADGVASGAALVVSAAFFAISILNADIRTAFFSLILWGAVFSFFLYNFPPAKIYMGNSGSHFLGFILASIALMISYASLERKVALLTPLLILGLPIFDTTFLILIRLINKSLPFKKTNDHLALRFLAKGFSKKKTLFAMLGLCLFFCLCGILISQVPNTPGICIVTLVILVSLITSIKMGKVAVANG